MQGPGRVRPHLRPRGRPVAVEVLAGNTADPSAFISAAQAVREHFGLSDVVMVGDRGMITTARIAALKEVGGLGWLTALRAPAIAALQLRGLLLRITSTTPYQPNESRGRVFATRRS